MAYFNGKPAAHDNTPGNKQAKWPPSQNASALNSIKTHGYVTPYVIDKENMTVNVYGPVDAETKAQLSQLEHKGHAIHYKETPEYDGKVSPGSSGSKNQGSGFGPYVTLNCENKPLASQLSVKDLGKYLYAANEPFSGGSEVFHSEHDLFPLGEVGPSAGIPIPDPLQSLNEQAIKYDKGTSSGKSVSAASAFSKLRPICSSKSKVDTVQQIFMGTTLGHKYEPVAQGSELPSDYDQRQVTDAIRALVKAEVATTVKELIRQREEQHLLKISDVMSELMVKEREAARKLKLEVDKCMYQAARDISEMRTQMEGLMESLNTARAEVTRLEKENRSLRVSGTLNKLPRKFKSHR